MNKVALLKRATCFFSFENDAVIDIMMVDDSDDPVMVLGNMNGEEVGMQLDEIDIERDVFYELVPIDVSQYQD